jgi:hypothetical protein
MPGVQPSWFWPNRLMRNEANLPPKKQFENAPIISRTLHTSFVLAALRKAAAFALAYGASFDRHTETASIPNSVDPRLAPLTDRFRPQPCRVSPPLPAL